MCTYLIPAKHSSHLKENETEFIPEPIPVIMAQEHGFELTPIRVPMRKLVSENFTEMGKVTAKLGDKDISVPKRILSESVSQVYW